ncbi:MAG: hypothetical protein WC869_15825 [Phycisphaerae bacterium]|jgi:hypothetical protein
MTALTINFTAHAAPVAGDAWAHLEQIVPAEVDDYASLKDVHDLWLAAATGKSAELLRASNCPVEFSGDTILIHLGFYVWPSYPDLQFSLSAALGEINAGRKIAKPREFSLFVDNRSNIDLDFYMEQVSVTWESPTFDRFGAAIRPPGYTVIDGVTIKFDTEVFGAVRITGTAVGFHHVVTMTIEKPVTAIEDPPPAQLPDDDMVITGVNPYVQDQDSVKIESLENTLAVTWQDGDKTENEQLRLVIPKCVSALLAMCPDMFRTIVLICSETSTTTVYFNACNGEIISEVPGKDPRSFCSVLPSSGATANPWGVGTFDPEAFA